ncbi:hypothetical protein CONCODRAFT_170387 [Conidiobolus coronatus NRRL 28638]|uniref:RNI-like protein n=1 Tax=Conidiobolus coronatus (strain ATCC 28846 / CBS 209.66 / NRRL 28638) TaxID=796925 RepID=A0A137NPX1_CONC2|nr:hypothetical protein CONCODRAFT_170387 [Conidiobolus coronatus NRRL 28638]|eukprot:KXN64788.1 hypothetical protein CONCODRAFT_170387 [Conidiobolus coronatus NRRL 28638]
MALNNCSEASEIDWNNVFVLNELIKYFDIKSLTEFSLISKFNRNKLISRLFTNSVLIGANYHGYFKSNLIEYEGQLVFSMSSFIDNFWELNELNIELREQLTNIPELLGLTNRLINESSRIEPFIKSLRFFELGHLNYILYPTIFAFTNLTQLELDTCTFPLLALLRIGESLKKLKYLTLDKVLSIGFEKQELYSCLECFPSSLEDLKLNYFVIVTLNPNPSDIYIALNQHHKEGSEFNYFKQLKTSSLKRLHSSFISSDYVRILLNLNPDLEEITITDSSLDQGLIDKFSTMQSLTKLSIRTIDPGSPVITSHSGFIFPQFNLITELALDFSECLYKANNEFIYFTNHFPNLNRLSIDLTGLNFKNIDIGKFFLETLPSYKKLEILTLVYMDYEDEYNFNWLKFININCLILDFEFAYPGEINFNLFSYKIKEVRKRTLNTKFELECIEDNAEMFDKWNIKIKGEYIYFTK